MAKLLHYRLQPLLEIKTRAKKRAEIKLAKAIIQLEKEKKRLKELEEEKESIIRRRKECRMELHRKMSEGQAHVKDGSLRVNFLRKLEEDEKKKEEEIKAQRQVIENCEIVVKRARRDYIDASKDLRVMEKHKDLWRKKVREEISRQEEKEMDELGNVIHQLKRGSGFANVPPDPLRGHSHRQSRMLVAENFERS